MDEESLPRKFWKVIQLEEEEEGEEEKRKTSKFVDAGSYYRNEREKN